MHNGQSISLGNIIYKVLNNPIAAQLNYDDAAEHAITALRLLGAPLIYSKENKVIKIEEFKGLTPKNIIKINGVRYSLNKCDLNNNSTPLTYATDIYHKTYTENDYPYTQQNENRDFTYTIEKGIITISEEEGYVQINYDSLIVDEDGYPMIPNVEEVKLAVEYYILFRYLEPLWIAGKITDKAFQYVEQKKSWYMGSGNTAMQNPGTDKMQSIMNTINRLIPSKDLFYNYYKKAGVIEQFRRA